MANSLDSQQLIEQFVNGDPEAYRTLRQWIVTVARAGQLGRALFPYQDDIVQEVLMAVLDNLRAKKFGGRSSLKIYVQKIAQNICLNWWHTVRKQGALAPLDVLNEEPVHPGKSPYQEVEANDRQKRFGEAFRQLSKECQQLFHMVWEERRPYREIAVLLNTSEAAVKQRVHRCGQRLIELIGKFK